MNNNIKELYREKVGSKITDIILGEEDIEIVKEDGSKISAKTYHDQDCCENVYADYGAFEYQKKDIIGRVVKEIIVKAIEEMGFMICFYFDWEESEKVFIPCYNYQNGYYSSNLILTINGNKIDISDCVEDHID